MSAKQKGLFTCDEKISFDGIYESWHALRIELTGILIDYGLWGLQLCETTGAQALPERLFFQCLWLGGVLKMAVNNCPLRWPMNKGDKNGVKLLIWMKIKYESAAKLDPLRFFYADKIRLLKLRANGSLHYYIDHFQGLAILWREIDPEVQS